MSLEPTPIPPDEFARRTIARSRILAALQCAPRDSAELNLICYRYSARIMELRRDGWPIAARRAEGSRLWRYELAGPRGEREPRPVGCGGRHDPDLFA